MKARAVLLIDLENFYISREKSVPAYGPDPFAADLEHLLTFAREAAGAGTPDERPLIVRRAYANFNARRPKATGYGLDYFLQRVPDVLLDQGVEPVQVFQLSRGGTKTKNAADMRMAMDATALLATASGIEQFIMVTGDADFIPVILELKRHGRDVAVIGVRGATSQHLQRFVDSFDFFEDLLAAGEVNSQIGDAAAAGATGPTIPEIAKALAQLLSRTRQPIKFAAVKPLLTKELNRPFDPLGFGYESTGDFLRRYAGELRIEVRHGAHDWEIDRPGTTLRPKPEAKPEAKPDAKPADAATPVAVSPPPTDGDSWHTVERYTGLLKKPSLIGSPVEGRTVGINKVVPWAAAARIGREMYARIGPGAAGPVDRDALRKYLLDDPTGTADTNHSQYVSAAVFLLRLFGRTVEGDGRVTLADGIESGEHVAICLVNDQLDLLAQRLAHNGTTGPEPAVFAELLRAEPADNVPELVTRLLAQLSGSDAEPAAEEPADTVPTDAEPAAEAELAAPPELELVPQPEPEIVPQPEPELVLQPEPEIVPPPEPEFVPESQSEPEFVPQPESEFVPEAPPDPAPMPVAEPEPATVPVAELEPATVPDPPPEPDSAYDDSIPIAEFVPADDVPADAPPVGRIEDTPPAPPDAVPPPPTDPA